MCTEIVFPADPVVKFIHNILFEHEKLERKIEVADSSNSVNKKDYFWKNKRSLFTRSVMQVFATTGAALAFSLSIFCQTTHDTSHNISYYGCTFLCAIIGYLLGILAGAIYARIISANRTSTDHIC